MEGQPTLESREEPTESPSDAGPPKISSINLSNFEVKTNGKVRGMTVVDDELFVLVEDNPAIYIFDSRTLTSCRQIKIPDMKEPQGLAGCSDNKALYISDSRHDCIFRVRLPSWYTYDIDRWSLEEKYMPYGVSVTPLDHHILVSVEMRYIEEENRESASASDSPNDNIEVESGDDEEVAGGLDCSISRDVEEADINPREPRIEDIDREDAGADNDILGEANTDEIDDERETAGMEDDVNEDDVEYQNEIVSSKVLEYTTEGQLIREIELDGSIEWIWQTIKLSSDQFIVSHGWCSTSFHRLCVVNSEGQIIKSYGGLEGNGAGQLCVPLSITIDNYRDLVFVADQINRRILMFSRDLILLGQVQSRLALSEGSLIYYDSSSDRLFVDNSYTDSEGLIGLTLVDDAVYVAYSKRSFILVYDAFSLDEHTRIYIPELRDPRGLASCSYYKALYISDNELKCVHKVNLRDNSVMRWRVQENYELWGLSVTSEHNILITLWNKTIWGISNVQEYTSDGQLLLDIELDESIEEAWHAIRLSQNEFIICHGGLLSSLHRICIINNNGQVVRSYGGEGGEGVDQLNVPRSITVDTTSGHFYVADQLNDRILAFTIDLALLGQVKQVNELFNPLSVYFDANSDRLFVGDNISGRILIHCSPDLLL